MKRPPRREIHSHGDTSNDEFRAVRPSAPCITHSVHNYAVMVKKRSDLVVQLADSSFINPAAHISAAFFFLNSYLIKTRWTASLGWGGGEGPVGWVSSEQGGESQSLISFSSYFFSFFQLFILANLPQVALLKPSVQWFFHKNFAFSRSEILFFPLCPHNLPQQEVQSTYKSLQTLKQHHHWELGPPPHGLKRVVGTVRSTNLASSPSGALHLGNEESKEQAAGDSLHSETVLETGGRTRRLEQGSHVWWKKHSAARERRKKNLFWLHILYSSLRRQNC